VNCTAGAGWNGDQQPKHPATNTTAKAWNAKVLITQQQSRRHSVIAITATL
jgi:hypothetical protein